MDAFLKDLKQSLRMFAKRPAFTLAAVAALTLGIGVNTAVFSVVNAVLLRPVAFPDPDRLVLFMNTSPQGSGTAASPAKFQHYRSQTDVVQEVSAYNVGVVNYTGGSSPEQLKSGRVCADASWPLVRASRGSSRRREGRRPRSRLLGDALQ
jgi:hypothetical protein